MKHLFKQTVKIFANTNRDEYNEETFSAGQDFKCRFRLKTELVPSRIIGVGGDVEGERVVSDAVAFIDREATILHIGCKVTISNQNYRVLAMKEALNDLGNREYYKVWLQRWDA